MFEKDLVPLREQLFNHTFYHKIDSMKKLSGFYGSPFFCCMGFWSGKGRKTSQTEMGFSFK